MARQRHMNMGCVITALALLAIISDKAYGEVHKSVLKKIDSINRQGPFLGIVVPNAFEMNPLLQSPSFQVDYKLPYFDFSGRRFRFGKVKGQKVIVVMTGLSMLNAGITTELLLTLFKVSGVLHYGIAGNADPKLQIGDVTIPQYWAHTGVWNWQRNGDGPDNELALESNGDYTRELGYLKFSTYNSEIENEKPVNNALNNVWYQPEEVFPVHGTPEIRQHAFWIPVDKHYFSITRKLKGLKFGSCVNSTSCLPRSSVAVRVKRGISANVFVDNEAYRSYLYSKFKATSIDMESAAVALVSLQHNISFIAIRSLSDLAGGGSALSNESDLFSSLAAQNAVDALIEFISFLSSSS